ncbi:hypothetical protein Pmani_012717 [Petrolisthes manimaculis]|uniref:Signal transducing adapter molecule 1 n=1 Tax=Petrolisthes manimaculis TaxID=1843537 RepID=A0AAE1PXC9_9EUCA|nr:hypothetical protein Pmani_012717 [Petrolisthes manimaculis]
MGIFSTTSPFDQFVERATSEKNTSEDWGQIMDICDRVKENNTGPRDCLKSIVKRLNSENPRVVLQAVTLLDACINNCGRKFLLEVASREFEQEIRKHITGTRTHHKVSERLRESLKKWAEGEFKGDPQLSLVPALYNKLKQEGYEFVITQDTVPGKKIVTEYSNDPNVVNSKQEEDDIARAIQLSLQEGSGSATSSQGNRNASPATGLYSSAAAALSSDGEALMTGSAPQPKEALKARALYDFEAAEDNELTFKAGEIVLVQDNSDPNWWKGTNHRGEGLFPANFVTLDLTADSDQPRSEGVKRVSFSECVEVTEVEGSGTETGPGEEVTGEVDEAKIDRLLHVLHEADPTGERPDPPELATLEEQVNAMAPTIDADLELIDRQHAQLARISTGLVDALALYHQLMREMPPPSMPGYGYPGPVKSTAAPMPQPHQMPHPTYGSASTLPPQQMYGGPMPFPPYMGTPAHFPPPPGVPPTTATATPVQPPPPQPSQQPGVGPPHPGQTMPPPPLTQPSDFQQMQQPSSHEGGMGGNLMQGYGQFPPNSQFAGPPSTHPSMLPPTSLPPSLPPDQHPGNFPIYSQPQTVHQPLL